MFTLYEHQLLQRDLATGTFYPDTPDLDERLHAVGALQKKLEGMFDFKTAMSILPIVTRRKDQPSAKFIKIFETKRELVIDLLEKFRSRDGQNKSIVIVAPNQQVANALYDEVLTKLCDLVQTARVLKGLLLTFENGTSVDFVYGTKSTAVCGRQYDYAYLFNLTHGE